MTRVTLVFFLGGLAGLVAAGETPTYLWASLALPPEAISALPERAQTAGIPMAIAGEDGTLSFVGADSEKELLAAGTYVFLDGPFFLLGIQEEGGLALLRGEGITAEIISLGSSAPLSRLISVLDRMGLLAPGTEVEFVKRAVSPKIPAPPPGVRLDPKLWGLLVHPDWFSFAREHGIERKGLRVRVVAEVEGMLPEAYEPYIQSSSDGLVELLLPIPLLDDLAREEGVLKVRPPHIPHPLAPGRP